MITWYKPHWNTELGYKIFIFNLQRKWTENWHIEITLFDFIIFEAYFG